MPRRVPHRAPPRLLAFIVPKGGDLRRQSRLFFFLFLVAVNHVVDDPPSAFAKIDVDIGAGETRSIFRKRSSADYRATDRVRDPEGPGHSREPAAEPRPGPTGTP